MLRMGCNLFVYLSVSNEGTTEPTGDYLSFTAVIVPAILYKHCTHIK